MYDPTEPGHIPVYNLHDIPVPPPPPLTRKEWQSVIGIILLVLAIGGLIIGGIYFEPQSTNTVTTTDSRL